LYGLALTLAALTTPGKHSLALTSCHSPVVGSCIDIQPGCLLHLITSPRFSASASFRCSHRITLSRSPLCRERMARSSAVSASAGVLTSRRSPSAWSRMSRLRRSSKSARAFKPRTPVFQVPVLPLEAPDQPDQACSFPHRHAFLYGRVCGRQPDHYPTARPL
jgi:hypothetical protein